jgi:hypothetical protein
LTTVAELPATAGQLVEPGDGIVAGFFVNVRVDLHRGRDVDVTEDHLSVPRRHMQLLEQRRSGVPEVVHFDRAELVVVTDPVERPDQVSGLDGQAAAGGEYQAGVLPGPPEREAVRGRRLNSRPAAAASASSSATSV